MLAQPLRFCAQRLRLGLQLIQPTLKIRRGGVGRRGRNLRQQCHRVNEQGVPVQLKDTEYYHDYWASVVLLHAMRDGDQKMPVNKLVEKYPYLKAKKTVQDGWE